MTRLAIVRLSGVEASALAGSGEPVVSRFDSAQHDTTIVISPCLADRQA